MRLRTCRCATLGFRMATSYVKHACRALTMQIGHVAHISKRSQVWNNSVECLQGKWYISKCSCQGIHPQQHAVIHYASLNIQLAASCCMVQRQKSGNSCVTASKQASKPVRRHISVLSYRAVLSFSMQRHNEQQEEKSCIAGGKISTSHQLCQLLTI